MRSMKHVAFALASLVAIGCGGDETTVDGDELVGVWQRFDGQGALEDQFTFGSDGLYKFDEFGGGEGSSNDHMVGTWRLEGEHRVIADSNQEGETERVRQAVDVYVQNGDTLVWGAMYPIGEHDGVFGTWSGQMLVTALDDQGQEGDSLFGGEFVYEIRSDATATITKKGRNGAADEVIQAEYEINDEGRHRVFYRPQPNYTVGFVFDLIDDAVLGSTYWTLANE
jgi:hypothetical protein